MVALSGSTPGSGVLSSADDVVEIMVVRGVRSVAGVCEMCMCLARCEACGGERIWFGLGFTNPVGACGVWDVCLCLGCGGVGCVGGSGWWLGILVLCLCVLCIWHIPVFVYCARRIPAHLCLLIISLLIIRLLITRLLISRLLITRLLITRLLITRLLITRLLITRRLFSIFV